MTILLVDDHRMLRDGLRLLLQGESGFEVVGEAGDVRTGLELTQKLAPNLVIMDIQLPDGTGIDACREIVAKHPDTRVLILSGNPDMTLLGAALRAGARGYLLKEEASDELVRAVRAILAGNVFLCPAAATALVNDLGNVGESSAKKDEPRLSERELQVLKLISDGLRNKEIAADLHISTKSVETYRSRLLTKLGFSSTAELVRYAVREKIARA